MVEWHRTTTQSQGKAVRAPNSNPDVASIRRFVSHRDEYKRNVASSVRMIGGVLKLDDEYLSDRSFDFAKLAWRIAPRYLLIPP